MRRILWILLALLFLVLLVTGAFVAWLGSHPERVNAYADNWLKSWVAAHPLEDGVKVHWDGLSWQPWTGLHLGELSIQSGEDAIKLHGLKLEGLGYSQGIWRLAACQWDSLVIKGTPSSEWGHWVDPWLPTDTTGAPFLWSIGALHGQVRYQAHPGEPSYAMAFALREVSNIGASGLDATLELPLKGLEHLALHGDYSEEGEFWSLTAETDGWLAESQLIFAETGPVIQWDVAGKSWEGSASGAIVGDTSLATWKLLATQAFWRDRTWLAEGSLADDQWTLSFEEEQEGHTLASVSASGDFAQADIDVLWQNWHGGVLDAQLQDLTVDGQFSAHVDFSSSLSLSWKGEGAYIAWADQRLKGWALEGDGPLESVQIRASLQDPHVQSLVADLEWKRNRVNLVWSWNENTTWLEGLGLPLKGAVDGYFSWANGGHAHVENALDEGYSPLFLDWQGSGKKGHSIDLRVGNYRASLYSSTSPLEWTIDKLPNNASSALNEWLEGRFLWPQKVGLKEVKFFGPDMEARYTLKKGYQQILVSGDGASGKWNFESSSPTQGFRPVETHATLVTDGLKAGIDWLSRNGQKDRIRARVDADEMGIKADLVLALNRGEDRWNAQLQASTLEIQGRTGQFSGGQNLEYDWNRQRFAFNDALIWSGKAGSIGILGALSPDPYEVLRVQWEALPLPIWTQAFGLPELPIGGELWGQFIFAGAIGEWQTSADAWIPELTLDERSLGTIESQWDVDMESGEVAMKAQAGWPGQDSLWFEATGERNPTWDVECLIDRLPLTILNGFTEGSLDAWSGWLNAEVSLREQKGEFVGSGRGTLESAGFTLPVTGVRYEGSPRFRLQGSKVLLEGNLKDSKGVGSLALNGTVDLKAPAGKTIDVRFSSPRFLALDLDHGENFYGFVRALGAGKLHGGFAGLRLDIEATPLDSSLFVLPLDAPVTLDDVGFMSFRKREATALGLSTTEVKSDFRFDLGLKMHVKPTITARIILDETVGDILEGQGEGELSIDYLNSGDLQMNGMLTLNKGTYLFTLENLINKPFSVEPGASLTWSGDPYHAQVDLTAVYKTRTNPGPYLGLNSQERLPVDVKLHVTDDLMQPNLGFDIALPTAGSATQAALQSRLVTADEKTTQVLSLLTLHSFWDQQQGWSTTGVSAVETNTTQVLAQQFSNFMSQGLGSNWDVQLAYSNDAQTTQRQMDASIGRSFLDDRLTIQTEVGIPVGVRQTSLGLGDVTLTYRLSEDGRWVATAYSVRNADMAFTGQPVAQKQGLGVQLQLSGSNWNQLWQRLRTKSQP